MDLTAIGTWAANHGPLVGIIALQWAVIWRMLDRIFAQQDLLLRAIRAGEKAIDEKNP